MLSDTERAYIATLPREVPSLAWGAGLGDAAMDARVAEYTAKFANPIVPLKDLEAANIALDATILPENKRSNDTDMVMEEKKLELLELLVKLSNYVLLVANGDRVIAGLSGFKLTKEEKTPDNPTTLELDKVTTGSSAGTARVSLKSRAGCAIFIVQLKNAEGEYKMFDAFNTTTFDLEGLPAGESLIRIYGKKGKKKSPMLDAVVRAS